MVNASRAAPWLSALFERVFTVREDLVRALAPPGIEGAEAIVRSVTGMRVRS